ncbi:uncharacterized protein LOC142982607 [Anticarsia gemmatalis]|uniref:uncharacterized protein LOC142982607 n=1 Tax=Anticarsia gemmatalis TaxID=129554 RepID=UPI003F767B13
MAANALQSHIADGFADDCDELMHRCLKESPVNFKVFYTVFRDMQMSSLFEERSSGAEIAELSEEVINIAKYYMVANTSNFEESVVGLFLVYALVKLQPFKDFAHLHLVDEDVPYIERIEQVARRDKRVDILYILGTILAEHTRFHAAARERGMEQSYRKYLEGCPALDNLSMRPKGVFLRQNEELDIIKEMSGLHLQYEKSKQAINAGHVDYTDKNFANDLGTSLMDIISGIHGNKKSNDKTEPAGSDDDEDEYEEEDADRVKSIKAKAMKAKVKPVGHLVGAKERATKKRKPQDEPSGSQSNPNSSKKSLLKGRKRKRLSSVSSTSSSQEDEPPPLLSEHESDGDVIDIDVGSFDKPKLTAENTSLEEISEVAVDNDKIRLSSLPCVITSEDGGQTYQIEVIDKLKESTSANTDTSNSVIVRNVGVSYSTGMATKILGPSDKRDQKKTILKSRFKRMGIDPIANFQNGT